MADPYSKIRTGESLDGIPAAAWNSFVDAAQWVKTQQQFGGAAPGLALPERGIVVPIRNDSGEARARFDILQVSDFLIDPEDNENHFNNRPCLIGDEPDVDFNGNFVILQEPAGDGKIAKGLISGISRVRLFVDSVYDAYADTIDGDPARLQTAPFGSCRVIARESGTGSLRGYVLMNTPQVMHCRGVADEDIGENDVGAVIVWRRTSATALEATDIEIEALNDLDGNIDDGAVVHCVSEFDFSANVWRWRIIQADCPA